MWAPDETGWKIHDLLKEKGDWMSAEQIGVAIGRSERGVWNIGGNMASYGMLEKSRIDGKVAYPLAH